MQEQSKVSKGTILYSTILKATQDAAHEFLLRQFENINTESVAQLETAKFASALKAEAHYLREEELKFFSDAYTEQWADTYVFLREKLAKLNQ